jgi:hypothetical protein
MWRYLTKAVGKRLVEGTVRDVEIEVCDSVKA